jgi:hypothetical protein
MIAYQPVAQKQNSYFVNKIPAGLKLRVDKEELSNLLGSIFNLMAGCSRDTCIQVTAGLYLDMVLLHINDTSTFNSYAISSKHQLLQQMAEKLGGLVTITSDQPKETTITFSFTNVEPERNPAEQYLVPAFINGFARA